MQLLLLLLLLIAAYGVGWGELMGDGVSAWVSGMGLGLKGTTRGLEEEAGRES